MIFSCSRSTVKALQISGSVQLVLTYKTSSVSQSHGKMDVMIQKD